MIEMGSTRPDLRSKGMFSTMCHEENSGWGCRSERGHTGPHVSLDRTDQVMWIWEWEDSSPEEVEVTPEILRAVAEHFNTQRLSMDVIADLRREAERLSTPETPGRLIHDTYAEADGYLPEEPWHTMEEHDKAMWEKAAQALLDSEFRT
jgi:hypothetical protein